MQKFAIIRENGKIMRRSVFSMENQRLDELNVDQKHWIKFETKSGSKKILYADISDNERCLNLRLNKPYTIK